MESRYDRYGVGVIGKRVISGLEETNRRDRGGIRVYYDAFREKHRFLALVMEGMREE